MLYHPDPAGVADHRVWKDTFWRYFHISTDCVGGSPARIDMLDDIIVDCVRRTQLETSEQFEAMVRAAREELGRCLVAARDS